MRLAAPGSFGRQPHEMRIGRDGNRQAGRQRVHHVIAADTGQSNASACRIAVDHGTPEEAVPMRVSEQPEDDVPPDVHVVRDHEQLAKSRLTKVLEQQIDVVASELFTWRRRNGRGAANQAPQLSDGTIEQRR